MVPSQHASLSLGPTVYQPIETYLERTAGAKQELPELPSVAIAPGTRTFPLAQLQDPDAAASLGIDLTQKEEYLSESDFRSTFGMDKMAYRAQPKWKRDKLKRDNRLF